MFDFLKKLPNCLPEFSCHFQNSHLHCYVLDPASLRPHCSACLCFWNHSDRCVVMLIVGAGAPPSWLTVLSSLSWQSSLVKWLLSSVTHFLIRLCVFLLLGFQSSPGNLNSSPLLYMRFVDVFLFCSLFPHPPNEAPYKKFLISTKFHLFTSFLEHAFDVRAKNP